MVSCCSQAGQGGARHTNQGLHRWLQGAAALAAGRGPGGHQACPSEVRPSVQQAHLQPILHLHVTSLTVFIVRSTAWSLHVVATPSMQSLVHAGWDGFLLPTCVLQMPALCWAAAVAPAAAPAAAAAAS